MNGARFTPAILWIIALGNLVSAVWMLIAPVHWYFNVPAGVPDFGPANLHFLRDIGASELTLGAALAWAAWQPAVRLPLVTTAALFFAVHALLHVFDTATGHVGARHWWLDFPTSYLPAILLVIVAASLWRARR